MAGSDKKAARGAAFPGYPSPGAYPSAAWAAASVAMGTR